MAWASGCSQTYESYVVASMFAVCGCLWYIHHVVCWLIDMTLRSDKQSKSQRVKDTHRHTQKHTHRHTQTHTHTLTHTHAHTHTHTDTHLHTQTHTRAHTHTLTHTRTRTVQSMLSLHVLHLLHGVQCSWRVSTGQ
jgi:ABC-type nickel/cobalt efflux system permease component RcnA